ncbi:hypothetical protein [Flavobacterium aestivum]|uniref:hypothetical protein n=1 Tax=Flavobacterium aestivum TaxID=3003257 RepID=UPI002482EFF5|nr:hypothetical protein [Flavobacterium aestivum]
MNLRNIGLFMSYDSGYKDPFRDNFNLNTKFINNFITRKIRPLKILTDGTFNMINIEPSVNNIGNCKIKGEKAINANVNFNKDLYLGMNEIERNNYSLELLNEGYKIISKFKNIDVSLFVNINNELKSENFINEWTHKKKKFKEQNLEVELICKFSASDFKLIIVISDMSTKDILLNDVLIRTLPDEVCFSPLFKDIQIINNQLIITEFQNRPKFIFNLIDVYDKKFIFEVTDVGLIYKKFED